MQLQIALNRLTRVVNTGLRNLHREVQCIMSEVDAGVPQITKADRGALRTARADFELRDVPARAPHHRPRPLDLYDNLTSAAR